MDQSKDFHSNHSNHSKKLLEQVGTFVRRNETYYKKEFSKIQKSVDFPFSWNTAAALLGPFWNASRGLWGSFWCFLLLELFVAVQMGRVLWHESETTNQTLFILIFLLLLTIKIWEGFFANILYEKRYLSWLIDPDRVSSGQKMSRAALGGLFFLCLYPMTIFRFAVTNPDEILSRWTHGFLGDKIPITLPPFKREFFSVLAKWADGVFEWLAVNWNGLFEGITAAIISVLGGLEAILIQTPWPVTLFLILILAFQLAGRRVALFTGGCLIYLLLMGLWEMSMMTVALIGTGSALCILIGIPIGVALGRNSKANALAGPILDFMQTMPAFVYLIPIIAFFGTGKPPGVLATIIFAIPPIIRLTALGIRNVPGPTKEAARAFGCSEWQLLKDVEIPLAMPSIMTGVNQTILMSLSMVVIASLIGAEGLGALILESLQYAAKGQGLLAGLAILFCAMTIDRITQGPYRK
ncbi:MAG: ABC transporter permease subunit [Bacteriovoracales bacterium]|nr:ABC transporter permease subunit [Bacteriovoracales bacterium]